MLQRQTRARIGDAGIPEAAMTYFRWSGTIQTEWSRGRTEPEILAFWQANKEALMARYLADLKRKGPPWAGRRPSFFFDELESMHPRRKVGVTRWIGPIRLDGGDRECSEPKYESDLQYLARLGLLEEWEWAALEASKRTRRGRADHGETEGGDDAE